jgi:para-nitrobenzyl esterase
MADTTVRGPGGLLRGVDLGEVRVWRGVPFAAPPVGDLRFRPPRPVAAWDGERDCSAFGPTSPQLRLPALRPPGRGRAPRGREDCLYLNVWSPGPDAGTRPVLVWIHGGGFVSGAGSSFDAAPLAARGDAVVVTVNYRLGPWGNLALDHDEPSRPAGSPGPDEPIRPGGAGNLGAGNLGAGNLALLDQIAALRWVRAAAAAFGGDPDRVTVFGESAGAMYIGALLAAPAARGLFHRAVLQSGAARHVRDRAGADLARRRYLEQLGRPPASASTTELVRAGEALLADSADAGLEAEPFLPSLDPAVLPVPPMTAIAAGSCVDVPLLVTWCRDEMNLFLTLAPDVVPAAKEARARAVLGGERWRALLDRYVEECGGDPAAGRSALLTDVMFGIPAQRLADAARAAGGSVWMLRFDHVSGWTPERGALGVMHGADLALTWGRADAASDNPDRRVAARWQDALLAFARDGAPSAPGLPAWPGYDAARRATMLLSDSPQVVENPDGRRRAAWSGLPLP